MNHITNKHETKRWYDSDGKWHREDGPAIEWADGNKSWYKHGKRHREGGPACDGANGYKGYYLEDIHYSEEEYCYKIKQLKKCKLFKLKDDIDWI